MRSEHSTAEGRWLQVTAGSRIVRPFGSIFSDHLEIVIRLVWGFLCQGGVTPFSSSFAFHSFVRPAPRGFFRPDRIFPSPSRAAAVKDGACMGLSLSRGRHALLVVLCIPFFCSTRAARILPSRPHISIAVARSGGQGRRFFSAAEGLSLTDASTAAGGRRSGGWPRDDPRGACHWPRSIARTTLVFG